MALAWLLLFNLIMKIAIAHWQGRVSPVFDVSDRVFLIDVEDGRELQRVDMALSSRDLFARAKEVLNLGTQVLLCGAISQELERTLTGAGVQVIGFVCGDVETVLDAFLHGELDDSDFFMPGCCGIRRRVRLRNGHRSH